MPDAFELPRIESGVPRLDSILHGGLPQRSICVIAGRPGSGKTVLTHQMLFNQINKDRRALYLTTLAEPAIKMVRYMQTFRFANRARMNSDLRYMDIGDTLRDDGMDAVFDRIGQALKETRPTFVCVDSIKAVERMMEHERQPPGQFSHRLAVLLATWDATGLLVGEYDEEETHKPVFTVADSVILLRNVRQGMYQQRYLEVLKLRGSTFFGGLHPYRISGDGVEVFERVKTPEKSIDPPVNAKRVPSGIAEFDDMLSGGLQAGSATMIAGGSGTGKTLLGLSFVTAAAERGDRSIIVSFQENPAQLEQIASSFGWRLGDLKRSGLVDHIYHSPVEIQPDTHVHALIQAVERAPTQLVVLDSLKDLETPTPDKSRYKDFLYSLVTELKARGITVLLTNEIPELFGPFQFSEHGVSFITDTIVLLRYVELAGRMSRAINIMKMRGSQHSKDIREFAMDETGIRVLDPITAYSGVMSGMPSHSEQPAVRHLPRASRHLLEVIRRVGPSTTDQIVKATGLDQGIVFAELAQLEQQGLVLLLHQNNENRYRATV